MALVDRESLRANYEGLAERMRTDVDLASRRIGVSARLVHDVTVESTFEQYDRQWSLIGDEAAIRGGHERGPTPLRYFLSGIAICQLGWYAKGSAVVDCELEEMVLDVQTFMDMRGEHGFGDIPTHPQWLTFELRVRSSAPLSDILEMVDWGNERCPLGVLVRRAVPIFERVTLNDEIIRDTVPAEPG